MSIFTTILSKIFAGHDHVASSADKPVTAPPPPSTPALGEAAPDATQASTIGTASGAAAGAAFGGSSASSATPPNQTVSSKPPAPASSSPIDVAAVLNGLAAKNPEKLDWKKSIVDLLKLLDMDSSLSARKELAAELDYSGDTSDSAKMNVWLHQQVLNKLAQNGGKVPTDLLG